MRRPLRPTRRAGGGARSARRRGGRPAAACVLVSGGLDSCVLLRDALRAYRDVQPAYLRAGLRWEAAEVRALRAFLRRAPLPGVRPLVVLDMPMDDVYGSHWSTTGRGVPAAGEADSSVLLPGRNIALLSKAGVFCALQGIPVLLTGILGGNPFPDATPRFLRAMASVLGAGLGAALRIRAPYRRTSKEAVIRRGRDLPLEWTLSCSAPVRGRHCGRCAKCAERIGAFRRAGVADRTLYAGKPGQRFSRAPAARRRRPSRVPPTAGPR